jgi:hypothetical protein
MRQIGEVVKNFTARQLNRRGLKASAGDMSQIEGILKLSGTPGADVYVVIGAHVASATFGDRNIDTSTFANGR